MAATIADADVKITLTAVDPIHHGAGTSGNTALLRTQPFVNPHTGQSGTVPYVSGNAFRHGIRDALAWHLVRELGLEDGSLSVAQVALLWSGGALSEPGAKINIERLRSVNTHLPQLTLLGYSAGNDIVTSTLRAQMLHIVCAENVWRLPGWENHPHAARPAGFFRGENFGTRHDPTGGPTDRLLADSGLFDTGPKNGTPTQMIYDFQTVIPGTIFVTGLTLEAATQPQADALACALAYLARDGITYLGAKRAVGYGRCRMDIDDPKGIVTGDAIQDATTRRVDWITSHRDDILNLLGELAK